MKKRTVQIHFRATEQERLQYQNNASKCGLSLSEYLRKLANKYEPKPLPPLEYDKLIKLITHLYVEFNEWGEAKYADTLVRVLTEMQAAISPMKGGHHGDHENLGGS